MKRAELAKRHRVGDGRTFNLADVDPAGHDVEKDEAQALLADSITALQDLQERLFAEGKWAVLVVLQAMDAGGKDSAIRHVMTGINPQGCDVRSFKAPGPFESQHDFLWRHTLALPPRGKIVIFNRSHYEEVLVVRVHPEILETRNVPRTLIDEEFWTRRLKDIRNFERHLTNSGTVVIKFFLHISKQEQARRLIKRIDRAEKNWKFSPDDMRERPHWDDYMHAYEEAIRKTAREETPWYVVPADNKWYARTVISSVLCETLHAMDPQFPAVSEDHIARLQAARAVLARDAEH